MITASHVLLCALVVGCAPRALACGPDFAPTLLADRAATLSQLPDGTFALQMQQLLDGILAPDTHAVVVVGEPPGARASGGAQERALYEAGAQAFHAADHDAARAAFEAVLALPPEQRQQRSTWAAWMLARLSWEMQPQGRAEKLARLQQVRDLAADGYVDALGLAAETFVVEAGLAVTLEARVIATARRLRAGDPHAAVDLKVLARDHLDEARAEMRGGAFAPVTARLLAARAWTLGAPPALLDALAAQPVRAGAWTDRIAAALYRSNRIDDAIALKAHSSADTPLWWWIDAKLALRRGDVDGARRHLAAASRAFATALPTDGVLAARVHGEQAALALSQTDYVFALGMFLKDAAWWQDAAWVAERVLTLAALQAFVDAPPADILTANRLQLRALLARRLARAARYQDAVRYTDDAAGRELLRALDRFAQQTRSPRATAIDVAQAQYHAARIIRRFGMQLLGTQGAPDWAMFDGEYSLSDASLPQLPPSPWISADERARADASCATPGLRFHYRAQSMLLLEAASARVPARSQAYAALLCQASKDGRDDAADLQRISQHYFAYGAQVDFVDAFGFSPRPCPAPQFDRARAMAATAFARAHAATVGHARGPLGAFLAALGFAQALAVCRARRRAAQAR